MISANAKLTIRRIPLDCIQIKEYQPRYVDRLHHYIDLMRASPGQYAGLLSVCPSDTHPGLYTLLDGHHRYLASIMTGRADAMCVIIEEPEQEERA